MKNVLIISHSLIPSVLLCGHAQLLYLESAGKVQYKFLEPQMASDDLLSWADIIIFVRSESDLEEYTMELCLGKKHLVYVLDDDLLNLPEGLSSSKYYALENIHNNILKIMNSCDVFLTPSRILLKKYGKSFKYKYQIDEPSLNAVKEKKKNNKIKIGFAGSIDRTQDINNILEGSLIKIIEKYGDQISIEFMGAKPTIVDQYNLNYIPYQDGYHKYTEDVGKANWDIGLAPMPDSKFHKCKYFNKYVEYASFGIAGIYSDVIPYRHGIRNEENGLLVKNTEEDWFNAVCRLIDDEALRGRISKKCIEEANTIYALDYLASDYFDKMISGYAIEERIKVRGIWRYKVKSFFARVIYKIKEQKWKLPIWCFNKLWRILTGTNNKNNTLVNLTDVTKGL